MNTDKLSRRRLLVGMLAAWLCPRPRRAAAASHRLARLAGPQPRQYMHSATYTYDSMGRLISMTEHSPCPIERPPHGVHVTREHGGTFIYTYDCAGQGEQRTRMAR